MGAKVIDKEKQSLTECVHKIEQEINQNIDKHSQELIIHNIEAILKYANRFYDRQFTARTNQSKDYISKFEKFLKSYFDNNQQLTTGILSVEDCGKSMNMSGKYLSDLLKAETGKSLLEHIHLFIINKAKTSLLNSNLSVNEIAYSLGFDYPQHFTMLLLMQAVEKQENHSRSKGSNIVYIDVHIDQPNVEDCYETSVLDLHQTGWLKVYPNPNHGVFNLEMDQLTEGEDVSISIYDLAGKKVYSSDLPAAGTQFVHELNLSTLLKGVYLIQVQVQQHSSVERLIIF